MGNIIQMRKEAMPFLESLGIPKPRSKEEWSYIFKEMGTFLAAKNFIVNCPLPVMEMPVAPFHDSKEALRFRAICDERITLPLASLKAFDSVYTKLVAGLSKSSMVEVKANWRCNVVHDWVEQVPQRRWGPCMTGWAIPGLSGSSPRFGCRWPWGGSGQGGGPKGQGPGGGRHHAPHPRPGHQAVPAHHHGHGHGGCGPKVRQQALPQGGEACVLGLRGVWLGLAKHQCLGSGEQGKVQDHGGLYVQILGRRAAGTRLLQITGWHRDKATCLQLVMDEPPEQLFLQWIRDRMEFYKRVEPTEPPRDERLVLGDASTPRMRFSSSSGLGDVSTALWSVILSNPEKSGLAAIHSVAKEAILKGGSR